MKLSWLEWRKRCADELQWITKCSRRTATYVAGQFKDEWKAADGVDPETCAFSEAAEWAVNDDRLMR